MCLQVPVELDDEPTPLLLGAPLSPEGTSSGARSGGLLPSLPPLSASLPNPSPGGLRLLSIRCGNPYTTPSRALHGSIIPKYLD